MHLEIEIRSHNARNDIYELRNLLQEESGMQISIKQQAPRQGEMALGLVEPIIVGTVEALVGHSIGEIYSKMLKPKIDQWIQSKKNGKLQVLSSFEDDGSRTHFLEYQNGRTEVFENLKYAIDPKHTRAVLIGNSEFEGGFSAIPPVKGNLEDFYRLLTDKLHIGLMAENISVVFNKTNTEIEESLLQQSRVPDTETLVIYFAGHGHRTDVKKLYLVARNSKRIDDYLLGGVDFDFINNVVLRNSTAKQKILILDACHSGIATQGTDDMLNKMDVKGSYVLASSSGDEVSYFEKNNRNTYFTGVLLDLLKTGIENSNEMIALDDLYEYSKTHLTEKNFPHPIYKNELNIPASNFFIARNPSFSFEKVKQKPERLVSQGRFEEALYEYRMLLQRYPDDLELRKKASECETNALFNRLMQDGDELFFHVKDYRAAIDKYKKALQIKEDILVRSRLSRCQDYLQQPVYPEKRESNRRPVLKKENTLVVPKVKEDSKKQDNNRRLVTEEPKKEIRFSIRDKAIGIALVALWFIISAIVIFNTASAENAFKKVSVPVMFIGIILLAVRWKNILVTELLLYAHGLALCLFPLYAQYIDSRDDSGRVLLVFFLYNIGYTVLLYKKLKDFKLADIVIASVSVLYLSLLFVWSVFYASFRPEYGENDTASALGVVFGLAAAVGGIIFMIKKWNQLKRKQ